jgi:hypothetical protein
MDRTLLHQHLSMRELLKAIMDESGSSLTNASHLLSRRTQQGWRKAKVHCGLAGLRYNYSHLRPILWRFPFDTTIRG